MSAPKLIRAPQGSSETSADGSSPNADPVAALERDLRRRAGRRWRARVLWLLFLVAAGAGTWRWRLSKTPPPRPRFETQALEVRDITESVESTGRLKPVTEVQVGAQVSGRVVSVHADFNSRVKQGELLAEIDPQLFGAQVGQVTGQLNAAQANSKRAEANSQGRRLEADRLKRLQLEGLTTQAELDQAESALEVALAEMAAAKATITGLQAQLRSARTTLGYTKIYSPIDGVVITRNVESGQTVAASFSSPVMFLIAEDLAKMQVLADIDEADVGKIAPKMTAEVRVDAFAGERFVGEVTQIRYSPNEVQGVVTYSAVVDVANPDLKLRPGMTATVSITTREALQVLAAPSAALRFKPEKDDKGELTPLEYGQVRLYSIADPTLGQETLAHVIATISLSDGVWTQIEGEGLNAELHVVTEQNDKAKTKRGFLGLF